MDAFSYRATVSFADTDAAGIVHFSNILRYVERAEEEWLRSLGTAQFEAMDGGGFRGFPKVNIQTDYRCPLFPGDSFVVTIVARKPGRSSLPYEFSVHRGGADGVLAARGVVTLAYALKASAGKMSPIALPESLRQRLGC
ncbi:MAG: acyl-CoA thioesterase [Opitutales bacterium]|nr:acyl-CoA thioesterase [Opitutales bacterium]